MRYIRVIDGGTLPKVPIIKYIKYSKVLSKRYIPYKARSLYYILGYTI